MALTKPPFNYSAVAAQRVLDMPTRRLTRSGRRAMAEQLEEIHAYLKDASRET